MLHPFEYKRKCFKVCKNKNHDICEFISQRQSLKDSSFHCTSEVEQSCTKLLPIAIFWRYEEKEFQPVLVLLFMTDIVWRPHYCLQPAIGLLLEISAIITSQDWRQVSNYERVLFIIFAPCFLLQWPRIPFSSRYDLWMSRSKILSGVTFAMGPSQLLNQCFILLIQTRFQGEGQMQIFTSLILVVDK